MVDSGEGRDWSRGGERHLGNQKGTGGGGPMRVCGWTRRGVSRCLIKAHVDIYRVEGGGWGGGGRDWPCGERCYPELLGAAVYCHRLNRLNVINDYLKQKNPNDRT